MSLPFNLDETLGAVFAGFSVSCLIFGINTNQCFTYFQRYPEDRLVYKFLVSIIWILGFVNQLFIGHAVYFYTITNFAKTNVLFGTPIVWSFIAQSIVGVIIATIVRLCFAMRVWRFSKRNVLVTAGVLVPTVLEFILGTVYTLKSFQRPFFLNVANLEVLASFSLGSGAFADIFTAAALSFFLRRFRTGQERSDTLVNTLTIYAVNTGAVTAAIALLTLIFYDVRPYNLQFMASYFILNKLYAISFMCTLNTRKIIRGRGGTEPRTPGASISRSGGSSFSLSNIPHPGTTLGIGWEYPPSGGVPPKALDVTGRRVAGDIESQIEVSRPGKLRVLV
ncbi:hypothetical protein C8J57DRAFT_1341417 [Mycena rebaudengoi]|nr:hypothetical protein C8J57DRAFT_1341417 [Mycena rebaudengoi]